MKVYVCVYVVRIRRLFKKNPDWYYITATTATSSTAAAAATTTAAAYCNWAFTRWQ